MNDTNGRLPGAVTVIDITARDGFQNIGEWIPSEMKERVIDELAAAGVRRMEATSFVSPKAIPQMRDAARIAGYVLARHPEVSFLALAPNLKGAENAVAVGVREISYIISASAAHNQANIKRTHEQSLDDLAAIRQAYPDLRINLSMSAVFGCPFTGEIPVERVLWLLAESRRRGIDSVSLCDTIGVANPLHVRDVVAAVRREAPGFPVSFHLHDTHGLGLANTFAALQGGIDCFETAAGGLGGCPFAPGAAGNTSTEDMVNMLHRMGVATGIDLDKLLVAVKTVCENIKPDLPGKMAKARSYSEFCFYHP